MGENTEDKANNEMRKKALFEFYLVSMESSKPAQPLDALDHSPPATKVVGPSGREYHAKALWCMNVGTEPRRRAIKMVESRWFDPLILVTILINCTTMAWESPLDPPDTSKAALIGVMEWVYLYIFTFELISKVVAYGFALHEGAYLRDAWCQLDFVVVTLAWIPIIFPSFGNYSVIRSVRALRPLRALKRVPGMPQMISAIMAAFPQCAGAAHSACLGPRLRHCSTLVLDTSYWPTLATRTMTQARERRRTLRVHLPRLWHRRHGTFQGNAPLPLRAPRLCGDARPSPVSPPPLAGQRASAVAERAPR